MFFEGGEYESEDYRRNYFSNMINQLKGTDIHDEVLFCLTKKYKYLF